MSRIGKRPVLLTSQTKTSYVNNILEVSGPKGTLNFEIPQSISLKITDSEICVDADYKNDKKARTVMGTVQATIKNMTQGVNQGFTKTLNLVGVGYRASVKGQELSLNLGYSHPVHFELPKDIKATINRDTQIVLESCDKRLLGQTIADIQAHRPPEPYKGKGILIDGQMIRRKSGKSGKK